MIVLAVPGVVAALATAAAFFGGDWWWFDLLASFRPQLGILALLLGIGLMAGRWRRVGLVVLASAVVNAALVVPLYVSPPGGVEADGVALSVMSFNVNGSNDRYEEVMSYVAAAAPDVVFLHEVTEEWEEAIDAAELGYRVVSGRDRTWFGSVAMIPASGEARSYGFLQSQPRAIEVVLETGAGEVTLLGIHPLSPVTEERAALRDAQIEFAAEWAATREAPAIVVGDFNASPWSAAFRRLLDDGRLLDSERGYGLQLSFPATSSPLFRVPIDHLVHTDDVVVIDRRLGRSLGSDHFSLLVDLVIPT